MILVYRGQGYLVPLVAVLSAVCGYVLARVGEQVTGWWQCQGLLGVTMAVGGLFLVRRGKILYFEPGERETVVSDDGSLDVNPTPLHDFFYINVWMWGYVITTIGVILALQGFYEGLHSIF